MLLGAHLSIKEGLVSAIRQAQALSAQAIQIFGYRRHEFLPDPGLSESKRMELEKEIAAWRDALSRSGIRRVSVHSRAVALLAVKERERRKKFLAKFAQELELSSKLGAHEYVFHLGPYSEEMSAREGLDIAVDSLRELMEAVPEGPRLLLENVPGGGRRMGGTMEEIAYIVNSLDAPEHRFGICLDFAHLWGAGYDLSGADGARKFFGELEDRMDKNRIALFHFNNSGLPLACRLDQHAHMDQGGVAPEAYAYALSAYSKAAGVLETPKDAPDADARNLDFLRALQKVNIP